MKFILLALILSANIYAKTTKIGFLLSTLQEERYQKDKKFFEDKAKSLGAKVLFYSSDNSERVQVKKMENLLTKGVDVVVIQPVNSKAASTLVELADEYGVPVIAYDRAIENAKYAYYVTQNSYQVGVLQAKAAAKATKGKGNFLLLKGQAGHSVANAISQGVKDTLKNYPNIKLVQEKSHDAWSSSLAMATTENALTKYKGKIDAVISNNSGMASGAVSAIAGFDKKLLGKIFVAGADADLTAIKNIVKGNQQFEVLKDIKLLAETSAQVAFNVANKKPVTNDIVLLDIGKIKIKTINTPVFPVKKETFDEIIIGRGFHSKSSIYGKL